MRGAALVLVLFVALAGCAGSDIPDGEPSPATSIITSTTEPSVPTEPPVPTTDTLFFLKAPDMSAIAGKEESPEATPYSFGGGFGGAPPRWEYVSFADATPSEADASIWIRVIEPLFVPPSQTACVWSLEVFVGDEPAFPIMCSGPTGPTITAGDYELRFSSGSPNQTAVAARSTWGFQLRRTAFSPTPNESVVVLSASEEFPSRIQIVGLDEPKPPT
jgi:hypothetical protein